MGDGDRPAEDTSARSPYERSILGSLRRMSRATELYSRRLAKAWGLTAPQLICLRHLAEAGSTSPGELARAVSLSQGTVTGILDRLESHGLVTRSRDTRDKRVVRLSITEKAEDLIAQAPPALQERFARRLTGLPEGEQAIIDWVLRRIADLMQNEEELAPSLSLEPIHGSSGDADATNHGGQDHDETATIPKGGGPTTTDLP